jgi:hypothetical protein
MNEGNVSKERLKACGENPCVPMSVRYDVGDILKVQQIIDGHVFVFPDGPKAPNISYCFCLGCGAPIHTLYPDFYNRPKQP